MYVLPQFLKREKKITGIKQIKIHPIVEFYVAIRGNWIDFILLTWKDAQDIQLNTKSKLQSYV